MQSVFLMAAAAYCIRAAALGGKEGGEWLLKITSAASGWLGMLLPWKTLLWGNLKLEGAWKESSYKEGCNVKSSY